VGCSASGVIGGGSEIEHEPAISITAACLPRVTLDCWRVEAGDLGPGTAHSERLAALAAAGAAAPQLLVLADPFSFPTERLLRAFEHAFGTSVISGGLASGGGAPGECALFRDERLWYTGALVLALGGDIEMITAVAQGCRPIGEPLFVSACDGGKLVALDGRRPYDVLNDIFATASAADRALMQHSLFLGLAMRPGETRYGQGDFLVRNVLGGDAESGALWVGANLHENQVVQFHLRDAGTSAADLASTLAGLAGALGTRPAAGGLLFSCTGRGAGLYGVPGHDSAALHAALGPLPLGGFFCNGEIGQVAGIPFVHGYTSAVAVFRPRGAPAA
ncbi:MAG: FIST C-terminal domain-containing protein, partial [Gammaproteobacteria bacterium]